MRPEQLTTNTDEVAFFIHGTPIPQGSKSAYVVGTRAVVTDASRTKLKPWRAVVAAEADMGRTFTGPVEVLLTFHMPKPQRPKFWAPAVKPDIDKLTRAILDGLTDGGLIEDDARVVRLVVAKVYALPLGVAVTVREVAA